MANPSPDADSVKVFAVEGTRWVLVQAAVARGASLVTTLVLARLLLPDDFGVMALTITVLSAVLLFSDLGTTNALVQHPTDDRLLASRVFVFNLVIGSLWYGCLWWLAPLFSEFFHDSRLTMMLRAVGLLLVLNPLGMVHMALLAKALRFRRKSVIEAIGVLVGSATSLGIAVSGMGVIALAAGPLATQGVQTVLAWASVRWVPQPFRGIGSGGTLLRFGSAVSLQGILVWVINSLDNLLIGRRWNTVDVGIYSLGCSVALAPVTNGTNVLSNVFFPIYSRLQNDREGLRRTFLAFLKHWSIVAIPAGVMIATTAPLFVPMWFGDQWTPAVPIVQLVSIYGILASIGGAMIPLCNGVGRPGILVRYYAVSAALAIPAYVVAVPYGIVALAWAHVALVALRVPYYVGIPCQVLDITIRTFWEHVRVGVMAGSGLALLIGVLMWALSGIHGVPPGLLLGGVIVAGAVFWVGAVAVMDRRLFSESVAVGLAVLAPRWSCKGATRQSRLRRSA